MTWRTDAACRGMDRELFYPMGTFGRPALRQEAAAKAVCNGGPSRTPCPVRAQCLTDALEQRDGWGVFGGLTAEERAGLQRKQRRTSTTPAIRHVREVSA